MKNIKKIDRKFFWCCLGCDDKLAEFDGIAQELTILGQDSKRFTVMFVSARVQCSKCGKFNHIEKGIYKYLSKQEKFRWVPEIVESDIDIFDEYAANYTLDKKQKTLIKEKLSENQLKIFKTISRQLGFIFSVKDLSEKFGISEEQIIQHLEVINQVVKEIKGDNSLEFKPKRR